MATEDCGAGKPRLDHLVPGLDRFSGGRIEGFTEGWAIVGFSRGKPHYFEDITEDFLRVFPHHQGKDVQVCRALCGYMQFTDSRAGCHAPGNFPICKRCLKRAPRWANKEERTTGVEKDPEVRKFMQALVGWGDRK